MPVEIRELIIKTTVSDQKKTGNTGSSGGSIGQEQINEIAEKVFEIIQQKTER